VCALVRLVQEKARGRRKEGGGKREEGGGRREENVALVFAR